MRSGRAAALVLVAIVAVAVLAAEPLKSQDDWKEETFEEESALNVADQYTPDQADYSTFQTKPLAVKGITAHDPDSIGWIPRSSWENAKWDGKTVYNPSKMSNAEFNKAICPSVDVIRGIREVFYEHKPFADNVKPTKAEIDEWHRIAINHVRALIGYTSEDRKASKDHCMFARALWGDQRKFTTKWDTKYPGTTGSAFGPCQGSKNAHCGATFVPSAEDQAPFLPTGHPACRAGAGAEGVFGGPKSNIPWSIKWSRSLCNTLLAEGFWGGHIGPFFHREKFGWSFWDADPKNNNNNAVMRGKWTGRLMVNLHCNPKEAGCGDERPRCWVRMPTGCAKKLGETRTPKEYFVATRWQTKASCMSASARFNGWCGRSDAILSFGTKPTEDGSNSGAGQDTTAKDAAGELKDTTAKDAAVEPKHGKATDNGSIGSSPSDKASMRVQGRTVKSDEHSDAACGYQLSVLNVACALLLAERFVWH